MRKKNKNLVFFIFIVWIALMVGGIVFFLNNARDNQTSHINIELNDSIFDEEKLYLINELDFVTNASFSEEHNRLAMVVRIGNNDAVKILSLIENNNIVTVYDDLQMFEFFLGNEKIDLNSRTIMITQNTITIDVMVRDRELFNLEIDIDFGDGVTSTTDELIFEILEGSRILEYLRYMVEKFEIQKEGYRIRAFYDSYGIRITNETKIRSNNMQITIDWVVAYHDITLDFAGGHIHDTNEESLILQDISSEENLYEYVNQILGDIVKPGYSFVRWELNGLPFTETYQYDFELDRYFTLVAVWEDVSSFNLIIELNIDDVEGVLSYVIDAQIEVIGPLPTGVRRLTYNVFIVPSETPLHYIFNILRVTSASHNFDTWSINDENPHRKVITAQWGEIRTFQLEIDYGSAQGINLFNARELLSNVQFGKDEAYILELLRDITPESSTHTFGSWSFTGTVREDNLVVTINWIQTTISLHLTVHGDGVGSGPNEVHLRVPEIAVDTGIEFAQLIQRIVENWEDYINIPRTHRLVEVVGIGTTPDIITGPISVLIVVARVYSEASFNIELPEFSMSGIQPPQLDSVLLPINANLLNSLTEFGPAPLPNIGVHYRFLHWILDGDIVNDGIMVPNYRNITLTAVFEDERGGYQYIRFIQQQQGAFALRHISAYVDDENVSINRSSVTITGGSGVTTPGGGWNFLVNPNNTSVVHVSWNTMATIEIRLDSTRPLSHIIMSGVTGSGVQGAQGLIVWVSVTGDEDTWRRLDGQGGADRRWDL